MELSPVVVRGMPRGARRKHYIWDRTKPASICGRDARRHDGFEMLGPVVVDAGEIFVRDAAQSAAQLARHADSIETGAFSHDRLDSVDVVRNQLGRHFGQVRSMLDDTAKTFRSGAGAGETESGRVSLDVVGGTKKLAARQLGKAVLENRKMSGRQTV